MYFTIEQILHLILSGACLLVSSMPMTCFKSYAIALGPVRLIILCHFVAIAPIGLGYMA